MKVRTSRAITRTINAAAFYGTALFIVGSYVAAKLNKE